MNEREKLESDLKWHKDRAAEIEVRLATLDPLKEDCGKLNPWRPNLNDTFYYIDSDGAVEETYYCGEHFSANCFKHRKIASKVARKIESVYKLWNLHYKLYGKKGWIPENGDLCYVIDEDFDVMEWWYDDDGQFTPFWKMKEDAERAAMTMRLDRDAGKDCE
jgi:hypothetical protein